LKFPSEIFQTRQRPPPRLNFLKPRRRPKCLTLCWFDCHHLKPPKEEMLRLLSVSFASYCPEGLSFESDTLVSLLGQHRIVLLNGSGPFDRTSAVVQTVIPFG
jgi:hypothetical protein